MFKIRILALMFFGMSSIVFANNQPQIFIKKNPNKTQVVNKSKFYGAVKSTRTQFYPTHVIRLDGKLESSASCDDLFNTFNSLFDYFPNPVGIDWFGRGSCEDSGSFNLWISFDALNNEAIKLLETGFAKINGMDVYGQTLEVEPVKGILGVPRMIVGNFIPPKDQEIAIVDRENFLPVLYFDSLVDMDSDFMSKVWPNLFSTDQVLMKDFIKKWFLNEDDYYLNLLTSNNYIALEIKRIFLFDKERKAEAPDIVVFVCSKTKKGICKSIFPMHDPELKNM